MSEISKETTIIPEIEVGIDKISVVIDSDVLSILEHRAIVSDRSSLTALGKLRTTEEFPSVFSTGAPDHEGSALWAKIHRFLAFLLK
jgi:hypothetical protein